MFNRKISRVSRLKVGAMLAVAVVGVTSLATNIIRPAGAATIDKANNATNELSVGGAWVGNVAPGATDVAEFTGTLPASPFTLSPAASWGTLSVLSPSAGVTINNGTANATLAILNGLSVSNQSLTLGVSQVIVNTTGAAQTWSTATGASLVVSSAVNVNG